LTSIEDLKALDYELGLARHDAHDRTVPDTYSVSGKGFEGLAVRVAQDTGEGFEPSDVELLASLADPAARCERDFQHDEPEAADARGALVAAGYTVERPDACVDQFQLTDPDGKPVGKALLDPAGLVKQAAALTSVT
jgi:hypothetical protein